MREVNKINESNKDCVFFLYNGHGAYFSSWYVSLVKTLCPAVVLSVPQSWKLATSVNLGPYADFSSLHGWCERQVRYILCNCKAPGSSPAWVLCQVRPPMLPVTLCQLSNNGKNTMKNGDRVARTQVFFYTVFSPGAGREERDIKNR